MCTTGCRSVTPSGSAGPRNNFPLVASPRYLFIAGGIGITPILAMIRSAEAAGADWTLVYGGRQRASMAFLDELSAYGDRVTVWPQDEHGLLDLDGLLGCVGWWGWAHRRCLRSGRPCPLGI
jgi:ferredoxin-NADP reductase